MSKKQKTFFRCERINFLSLAFLLIIGALCFVNINRSATAEFEESLLAEEKIDAELNIEESGIIEEKTISDDIETPTVNTAPGIDTTGLDFSLKQLIVKVANNNVIANYPNAKKLLTNYYSISFDTAETTRNAYVDLSTNEDVLSVAPDLKVYPLESDINHAKAYYYESDESIAWGVDEIGANLYTRWNELNEYTTPVKVAVIDTGINRNHTVFKNRIKHTANTKNYLNGNEWPDDDNGHGTGVAGVIVESTPSNVEIYPMKVMNQNGETDSFITVLSAVSNAAEIDKVDIINLSLGVSGEGSNPAPNCNSSEYSIFNELFGEVVNSGSLVIAAAGNEAKNSVSFPANCSNVVAVSAIDQDRSFAEEYSNYGSEIDFAMPGTSLFVPWIVPSSGSVPLGIDNTNIVMRESGTSFASPFLAAAAALIKTENPNYTPAQIVAALKQNSVSYSNTQYYGNGIVDFSAKMFNTPRISVKSTATDWTLSDSLRVVSVSNDEIKQYAVMRSTSTPTDWDGITGLHYFNSTINQIKANGNYTVWVKTNTNKTASASVNVGYVDRTAPTIVNAPSISESDGGKVTISTDVQDTQSGLRDITLYYREKSSTDSYASATQLFDNVNTITNAKFRLSNLDEDTEYQSYIKAIDRLGNEVSGQAITFRTGSSTPASLPEAGGSQNGSNTESNNSSRAEITSTTAPEAVKTSTNTVSSPITVDTISTSVSVFATSSAAAIIIYYYLTRRRR